MKNKICPNCSQSVYPGNYCQNCGSKLTKPSQLQCRVEELENAINYYLECTYKKRAGSTIQYSIDILEKVVEE